MLPIELSTSNDCAREIRGTASIDNAVIGRRASTSTMSGFNAGASSAINMAPGFIRSSSSSDGVLMANTTSHFQASPTVAPASTNPPSGKSARSRPPERPPPHAQLQQLPHRRRRRRHTRLAGLGLPHHTDDHFSSTPRVVHGPAPRHGPCTRSHVLAAVGRIDLAGDEGGSGSARNSTTRAISSASPRRPTASSSYFRRCRT